MATTGSTRSHTRPLDLERIPSNPPSLTHTATTEHSDDATRAHALKTPPLSHRDLAGVVSDDHKMTLSRAKHASHMPAMDRPLRSPTPSAQIPAQAHTQKDDKENRKSKRLSLSRSLLDLRERAKDKANKRRSTMSEKLPARNRDELPPPVPVIPSMYKTVPHPMSTRNASESSKDASGASSKTTGGGLGGFFRKLRGKSKPKVLEITAPQRLHATPAPPAPQRTSSFPLEPSSSPRDKFGSLARKGRKSTVPQVEPPKAVRAVLAEMESSSLAIDRRATQRRSRRVPVPSLRPEDVEGVIDPSAKPAPQDREVDPAVAQQARADALARLVGARASTPAPEVPPVPELPSSVASATRPRAPVPPLRSPVATSTSTCESVAPEVESAPARVLDFEEPIAAPALSPSTAFLQPSGHPNRRSGLRPPPLSIHTGRSVSGPAAVRVAKRDRRNLDDFGMFQSDSEDEKSPTHHTAPTGRRLPPSTTHATFGPPSHESSPTNGECDTPTSAEFDKISALGHGSVFGGGSHEVDSTAGVSPVFSTSAHGHATINGFLSAGSAHGHGSEDGHGTASESAHGLKALQNYSSYGSLRKFDSGNTRSARAAFIADLQAEHASLSRKGSGSLQGHDSVMSHSTALTHDSMPFFNDPYSPRSPLSATFRDPRFAGSSPARVAPVGDGLSPTEGRSLSRLVSVRRKMSVKPKQPPTSFDAYEAKQREMVGRRKSCKPTIHSQASIAAEIRDVKNKEDERLMEACFMS